MTEGYSYFNERAGAVEMRTRYIEALGEAISILNMSPTGGLPDYFVVFSSLRGGPCCRSFLPARGPDDFRRHALRLRADLMRMVETLDETLEIQGPEGGS